MGRARLSDIAKKVGVSTVTVHNALAGNKGVSEEIRKEILKVAEEMKYKPPGQKKLDASDVIYTIGVLIAENYLAQYETFSWKMYQELAMIATEKRCFTAVEILKKDDELSSGKLPTAVTEEKIDALIILGEIDKTYISKLKSKASIPIIFLDFYDKDLAQDAVVADNFYGMYLMTEYMFSKGVDELGFVGSIYATSSIMDRYLGFVKSMLLHGKNIEKKWVVEDRDNLGQMKIELPKTLPRGFVCNCDLAASMLIEKLNERGLKVPRDIAVVGFDNYLYPGLADLKITSYEVNTRAMAKVAVEKVLKQIKTPGRGHGMEIVSGHIVLKSTV